MLKVTYIPVVSEDFAAHLKEEAARIDAAAQVKGEYPGPQGVVEWALPALFLFVVGGISTAVLSEAGKDIYKGLKSLVLDSYDEASRNPYEWGPVRKEPTVRAPGAAQAPQAPARPQPQPQPEPQQGLLSPPVRLTLETDELGARLSFVLYAGLSAQQLSDAYAAITDTARAVTTYSAWLYRQLASKRARPDLYQGTMPDSIWEERFQYEVHEASALLHAVFVFDAQAGVWGRVH